MPSALVAALAAPIREVQSLVGPGWSSDPVADPASALGRVRDALADVAAAARRPGIRRSRAGSVPERTPLPSSQRRRSPPPKPS
jgi:hypothetical protein